MTMSDSQFVTRFADNNGAVLSAGNQTTVLLPTARKVSVSTKQVSPDSFIGFEVTDGENVVTGTSQTFGSTGLATYTTTSPVAGRVVKSAGTGTATIIAFSGRNIYLNVTGTGTLTFQYTAEGYLGTTGIRRTETRITMTGEYSSTTEADVLAWAEYVREVMECGASVDLSCKELNNNRAVECTIESFDPIYEPGMVNALPFTIVFVKTALADG